MTRPSTYALNLPMFTQYSNNTNLQQHTGRKNKVLNIIINEQQILHCSLRVNKRCKGLKCFYHN